MYFKFPCTACGKNLKAREEHIGRKVGCPYCRAAVSVPAPTSRWSGDDEGETFDVAASAAAARAPGPVRTSLVRPSARTIPASGPRTDGTNVNLLTTGLIGAGLTLAFYTLLFPLRQIHIAQLFIDRGWVPYAEVFLMTWSVAILLLKYLKLKRQRASMLFDLLPTELSQEITVNKVDKFTRHIRALPHAPGESFLINRVLRGLEHFRVRKSAPEVASILSSQSEMDASAVASSYTMLKVFIWAIPILGFIGTVIGISAAVSGFSGNADDIDALKESLSGVTSGLATAFDTTLLALVMSMLIKFPTSSLQKSEEDMLGWVDEYCNENLLKRLNDLRDGGAERGAGGGRSAIQQAVDGAMHEHHVELRAWTEKLETIGETLSGQMAQHWSQINTEISGRWAQINFQMLEQLQHHTADQSADAETLSRMAADLQESLAQVHRGLEGVNDLLASLGEKQIIVEVTPAPERSRRGWMFWRSSNLAANGSSKK